MYRYVQVDFVYLDAAPGHQLVVSMAAGLDTTKLEDWLGESFRVIRVMPNTAVEVSRKQYIMRNINEIKKGSNTVHFCN